MREQEIRNQIEEIFSLNNIKEINSKIEELITNNKEYESLIRNLYEQKKSLLFKSKSYDELVSMYPDFFDSPIWKRAKGNDVNFITDLFRYLTEDEVFEKVKNVGLRSGPFYYDRQVFSKLSNQHKNEIIKAALSDDNVIELVRGSSNRELFDTVKSKVAPLKFIQLLNNENNINLYTAEEVLNIIKKIPTNELQPILKNLFILNKSPEIALYISKQCNLDSYTLNPYGLKDEINIEIVKNMSVEQLNNSTYNFKDCSDVLFNYFFAHQDITFLIKHDWGNDERTKKILDKVEKIDGIEKDYINRLTTIKDSKYILEKLEKYNFKNEDLYNYIGRLINLSSETRNYCTKKLGVESVLAYIGNYKNSIQDKRLEYLESIEAGTNQDELIHAFYSDGFRLEEIEAKLRFLKKHDLGKENLIKILNGWHCDEILMKYFIDTYGIDFIVSNYQTNHGIASSEKVMLDAINNVKGHEEFYLKYLIEQDDEYIISKLQTFKFSVYTLMDFLNSINSTKVDVIKKEKLLLETITDIKDIEKFYLEFLFKQDAEYITKKLKQFNVSKEICTHNLYSYIFSDNIFKGIFDYDFEIIWDDEQLLWKLNNEQLKSILNKVQKIDKKYINFLIRTGDSKFIEEKISEYKISFNQLYQSDWHSSLRNVLKETDLSDFYKLFDAFSTHENYSKEELNIILSKLESIEGIEYDFLRVITTSFSKVDGEFILEQLKKYNIDYKHIKYFYNDSWWLGLNKNLDEYLEDNYGTFYKLEKIVFNFSQEDVPKIKQLIDSTKSFKGAEDILIESLRKIDDINYIIEKLKEHKVDENILLKTKFIHLLDKNPKIIDTFCELYGAVFILENYGQVNKWSKTEQFNHKSLLYLLEKFKSVSSELQELYLDRLANLELNIDTIPFIIEKITNMKISPIIFSKYINNFLDKNSIQVFKYIDSYGNEVDQKNIIFNSIKQLYGMDFICENYSGKNTFVLREIFKYLLDEDLVNNLTDDEILAMDKSKLNWVCANKEKFKNFFENLVNKSNIIEAINFFSDYPLLSCCYAKNDIDYNELLEIIADRNYFSFVFKFFERSRLPQEITSVLNDLDVFLNATGKINTLEVNPLISYDFIKYIYQNLGLGFTINLAKFNTSASSELIETIKNGEIDLVNFYIQLYEKYNLFEKNDRKENIAFLNFSSFKQLIRDIKEKEEELNQLDINNLKNIILSANQYNINTVNELKSYKYAVEKYISSVLESSDISYIKTQISKSFCSSFEDLEKQYNGYDLYNFSKIKDALEKLSFKDKTEYKLTPKEIKIIILLKNIIECQDIDKLKFLLKGMIKEGEIIDYRNDFDNLIAKIRNIYGKEFNSILTDVNNLISPRDVTSVPGVTIIDLNGESFNFYAHRLYHYDQKFSSYSKMLSDDPSLWTKLEGSSTLSTSAISNKGLHFLHNNDPNGVVYLFNNVPENSLLFMFGCDLYVQHGGHQFTPTSRDNKFTDFESLVQATSNRDARYNEIALFREKIMPCGFACIGDTPNEATIRAAKYFSEVLKVDIPIIKLNPEIYQKQNKENQDKARQNFVVKANLSNLKDVFYDGTGNIEEKVEFCLNELKMQYKNGIIDYKEYIYLLVMMQKFIDVTCDKNDTKKLKRKVQLLRQSICILNNLTEQEIIEIETANLGESGIMYKMSTEDKEYLLKPSVEKESLKNQPFRAEIQKAASRLQQLISPDTFVSVDVISEGRLRLAKQEKVSVSESKKAFLNNWFNSGGHLASNYANQLLHEYVIDFLLCNFDCYSGNFIIDNNNNIRGIDKEQSFRFIKDYNTLDPSFSYNPNGSQRVPIYFKLFEEYKLGNIDLDLNIIKECIKKVEAISDEEYVKIFEKYAESLDLENKQMILQMILDRKKVCTQILKDYVVELQNSRNGGVKL